MRLFIAIQLNKEMKDSLYEIQHAMMEQGVRGNFTKKTNLHLTLAFIGEYPDPDEVKEVIEQVQVDEFAMELDGVGSFGRLWWAGIDGGDELHALAKRLRHALADAGIPYDRKKFSPHITLVRKPESRDGKIPSHVLENLPHEEMVVDHISLMRSDRGKNGMIYTEL